MFTSLLLSEIKLTVADGSNHSSLCQLTALDLAVDTGRSVVLSKQRPA